MSALLAGLGVVGEVLRLAVFGIAVIAGGAAALDWAVRTRRISPFSALARFTRKRVDPMFAPMERTLLRRGGNPVQAPWWTLAAVVVGGILAITLLDFVRGLVAQAAFGASAGPRGILFVLVSWSFGILRLAIWVRVLASWLPVSPTSPWLRWTYPLTDWLLRPLQRIVPRFGPVDVSPLAALLLLWLLEPIVLGLLRVG